MKEDIYLLADRIRSISHLGLTYSQTPFDTERYEKLLDISARLYSICDKSDFSDLERIFKGNLYHHSPMIGADAVIRREGKIFLIRRHDDKLWATPDGLVEVGETPGEASCRELYEETGIGGDISTAHTTEEALEIDFFGKENLPPLSPGHDRRVPFIFELIEGGGDVYCD